MRETASFRLTTIGHIGRGYCIGYIATIAIYANLSHLSRALKRFLVEIQYKYLVFAGGIGLPRQPQLSLPGGRTGGTRYSTTTMSLCVRGYMYGTTSIVLGITPARIIPVSAT